MSSTTPSATNSVAAYIEGTVLSRTLRMAVIAADVSRVPTYGTLKPAMYNGRIPFEKINGKLAVREADLPVIARAFGLTLAEPEPIAA